MARRFGLTCAKPLGGVIVAACLLVATAIATPALAQAPSWRIFSNSAPAKLPPGSEGKLFANVANVGDATTSGEVTVTDRLPTGLTATGVSGVTDRDSEPLDCSGNTLPSTEVSCKDAIPLEPMLGLRLSVEVKVAPGTQQGEATGGQIEVSGGGAAPAPPAHQAAKVSSESTAFGVDRYELRPEEEGGATDKLAGSHPFQLTSVLAMNEAAGEEPVGIPKSLKFNLPAGLVGNPTAVGTCSDTDFYTITQTNLCSAETVVGVALVTIEEPTNFKPITRFTKTVPVFNLEAAAGEPARFGFVVAKDPILLDTSVRTGSDYGVDATARDSSESAGLISAVVSLWGVPGNPRHDIDRGWACVENTTEPTCEAQRKAEALKEKEEAERGEEPKPFLQLPTSCTTPWQASVDAQSWAPGAGYLEGVESESPDALEGCEGLPLFEPSLSGESKPGEREPGVQLDTGSASTPAGLTVRVKVPQPETDEGRAESGVKATTVTLPLGMQLNPGAANRLVACSVFDVGFNGFEHGLPEGAQTENDHFSEGPASCPDAAKVGTVRIKSPDLKDPLTGSVYLAAQDTNPFQPPLVLYLIAEDEECEHVERPCGSGVLVKLAGTTVPDPTTGQLVSTFEDTPDVPFNELTLTFFGGGRASVASPPHCGSYTTTSVFTPWSDQAPATPSESFNITSGPGGGGCPGSPLPFSPSFAAGSTNLQSGAFTEFALTINRPDGNQALQGLTLKLPEGVAAMLSSVTPCPEPQASRNECGPESLIGQSTASSGLGGEPYTLPGEVFLTGPYKGAPFGLSVVTPAVAGPFNLGDVTVRSTINVNPTTAAVTITSDPFPTMLKGVPVQLKQIHVLVDRSGFQFNPTNCNRMAIEGELSGAEGGVVPVSSAFQVANCASLPFHPKLTASVAAQGSKANGVGFNVKVTSSGLGVAGIAKVDLALPAALPSRLTTIQKACPEAVFNANPATCDEGSVIGKGIIYTPVLRNPLMGPAYLVSHGNAAFPDVEFLLQGEGITLLLDGKTDIKKGITYSKFESNPDAPFTTFETQLPAGPHSALTDVVPTSKNYNLCGTSLQIPLEMTGQNGAFFKETTNVAIMGCKAVKAFKASRAQLLAKALAACRKKYKHSKKKRVACEKQAHNKYGPKKAAKSHTKSKKKK